LVIWPRLQNSKWAWAGEFSRTPIARAELEIHRRIEETK
jgi:hypothetical protein